MLAFSISKHYLLLITVFSKFIFLQCFVLSDAADVSQLTGCDEFKATGGLTYFCSKISELVHLPVTQNRLTSLIDVIYLCYTEANQAVPVTTCKYIFFTIHMIEILLKHSHLYSCTLREDIGG